MIVDQGIGIFEGGGEVKEWRGSLLSSREAEEGRGSVDGVCCGSGSRIDPVFS